MAGKTSFDLVVIGSGPGGYHAAIRAAQLGQDVACIETEKLGGVCLNIGCIPTKALLTSAFLANEMVSSREKHGIMTEGLTLDMGPAQQRSRAVADQLNKGIGHLFKKNSITPFMGYGRLLGGGKVEVDQDGEKITLTAKNVIIATGSRPRDLPILKIDEDRILSSTGALMQEKAPESLFIVGTGAIGMEFADVYNAYGSKVTMVEMAPNVLPLEDEEVSKFMERAFKKRGIDIHTGASFQKAEVQKDGVEVTFQNAKGESTTMKVDKVLSAVGRVPNTEDVGLEKAGVKTDDRGFIVVDNQMRTNVKGVYAIGDCAGRQLLAHKAMHEGVSCVEYMLEVGHHSVDYDNVPNCTYCHPEVASVGMTEKAAREAGHDIEVGKLPWVAIGRAVASGHADGFVKVIRDRKYSEILGAHIVGPHATELIAEFVLGRHLESTVEEIERAMHPHPTLSEGVSEGALQSLGRAIHI